LQNLLPETDYRLFAVCARYPQQMAKETALTRVQEGVYHGQRELLGNFGNLGGLAP
jgi:hypothetical protein